MTLDCYRLNNNSCSYSNGNSYGYSVSYICSVLLKLSSLQSSNLLYNIVYILPNYKNNNYFLAGWKLNENNKII